MTPVESFQVLSGIVDLLLAEDTDAAPLEQRGGDASSLDTNTTEGTIVNRPGAAGGATVFQHRRARVSRLGRFEAELGAPQKCGGDVDAALGRDAPGPGKHGL